MTFFNRKIGILGGGQLGRMIILEGKKMGFSFITLDPSPNCPAAQVADEHIVAAYDDRNKVKDLAEKVDVVIYEFENVDHDLLEEIENVVSVPQGSQLLRITSNRLKEKTAIAEGGIAVTPFVAVKDKSQLMKSISKLGLPLVLKTTTGGYDGKGQWIIHHEEDIYALSDEMFSKGQEYIAEQFISYERELSVVVARSINGEVLAFPPTINLHRQHILHMSVAAPNTINPSIEAKVKYEAERVAKHLQVVGLIAVEMFLLPNGQLYVNETAPRPHNSGHYTYDACTTSQFEQMLRAVLGMPLHSTRLLSPAIMVNLLGEHIANYEAKWSNLPEDAKLHWYGKLEAKKGRKMGHITFLGDFQELLTSLVKRIDDTQIWPQLTQNEKMMIFMKGKRDAS